MSNSIINASENGNSEEMVLRKELARIDIQRRSMEHEADAIVLELTTPPEEGVEPMGMDTPLIDVDGYPRGDVDILRARTLRQRFQILKNDHKAIEQNIDGMLTRLAAMKNPNKAQEEEKERMARTAAKPKPKFDPLTGKWVVANWDGTVSGVPGGEQRRFDNLTTEVPADLASTLTQTPQSPTVQPTATPTIDYHIPFARVDAVSEGSPAEAAGLQEEDLIITFGDLHVGNHNHLKAIAELVPTMAVQQKAIPITLKRQRTHHHHHHNEFETKTIQLTPRPWNGRGMMGCHIAPYHPDENSTSA